MRPFFSQNALLLGLPATLLLSAALFHSRAPRTQGDVAILERLVNNLKAAFPTYSPRKISVRGVSPDYAVWARYLAAPQPFALLPAAPGDTVLVVENRHTPPASGKRIWQATSDSFRIALDIQP